MQGPLPVEARPWLERVLVLCHSLGERAVVVFDLDSTLLDNRPRQARILREFGKARSIPALEGAEPSHWQGWDVRVAMRNAGLDPAEAERLFADVRAFWKARFFTSAYCVDDEPIRGAVEFVARVVQSGAQVAYVTGRHEEMRAGTVDCFCRAGFPCPPGNPSGRVHLLMKPTFDLHDDHWKVEVHGRLPSMGQVVAVFDNEPTHVNGYRHAFPEAIAIHLVTDHSGRPVPLEPGIISIATFVD